MSVKGASTVFKIIVSSYSMFTGGGKDKSQEDELKKTLQAYKKNHRSVYVYLSEGEKLIRSLRSFLMSGQLATEGAFWKADALVALYTKISDQQSRTLVLNFFVDVNLPETVIEIVRTLRQRYPQAFSEIEKRDVSKNYEPGKKNLKKKANTKRGSGDEKHTEVWCMTYEKRLQTILMTCPCVGFVTNLGGRYFIDFDLS